MFKVELSVPARVIVFDIVKVLDVVPPAIVNPVPAAVKVKPLTVVGVKLAPPIVKAGVGEAIDQVAVMPLLAAAVDTEVTVPVVGVAQVKVPDPLLVKTPAASVGYVLEFQAPRAADVI